jgi:hypothetical protein
MMKPMMRNSTCDSASIKLNTGFPLSPNACNAKPNNTEKSNTCKISPRAKASTTVVGITFMKKSTVDCSLAAFA